jgi:cytochrome c553
MLTGAPSVPYAKKTPYRQLWTAGVLGACALALSPTQSRADPQKVDELVRQTLQLDPDAEHGGKVYASYCARCHGSFAVGSAIPVIPSLAGQRRAYLVKQLADFAELERNSKDMHAVVTKPELSEPQVWADVSAYLNALPPLSSPQTGAEGDVELGEAIFQQHCSSCHEEDARGDDDGFVPSLRDQHYSYLMQQMRGIASWHRLNVDEDLVRFLDSLDGIEQAAVAAYLSRLHTPTRDRTKMRDDGTVND